MFVRKEHETAYRELFETTQHFCQLLFSTSLEIKFGRLDHAAFIANAFRHWWPDVQQLNYWPHFARKSREKATTLLSDHQYYDDVIFPHLKWLHECKTQQQLDVLADQCAKKWEEDGEGEYASLFKEAYVADPWGTWFTGVAGRVSGILPSQNTLESFHRAIKKAAVGSLRHTYQN